MTGAAVEEGPLRLFFALDLPDEHRRALALLLPELRRRLPPARWVAPENLHLTLAFLGAVPSDRLAGLAAAARPAFAAVAPFTTALEEAGTFPPRRPARVAWLGLRPDPGLSSMRRAATEAGVRAAGLRPDRRPFHPHVTIARPRRPWNRSAREDLLRLTAPPDALPRRPFVVEAGVLYRSELGAGGARYTPIERFPLAGAISASASAPDHPTPRSC